MNDLADSQERARDFNEGEAIQREFEDRRALRRLLGSMSPLPDDLLDELDWLEAARRHRQTRAVATLIS